MNDEQVNEYMQALLSGKKQIENFLERNALERFGSITTEIAHGQQRVQQLLAEAEHGQQRVQQLIGQRVAYSQLLVAAETARCAEAGGNDGKPLSLAEFRDKVGADKVEAVDNEGDTVDSSEGEATEAGETESSPEKD